MHLLLLLEKKTSQTCFKAIFSSFKPGIEGYILYDIFTKVCFVSLNVVLYETYFPYHKQDITLIINPSNYKNSDSLLTFEQLVFHSNNPPPLDQKSLQNMFHMILHKSLKPQQELPQKARSHPYT